MKISIEAKSEIHWNFPCCLVQIPEGICKTGDWSGIKIFPVFRSWTNMSIIQAMKYLGLILPTEKSEKFLATFSVSTRFFKFSKNPTKKFQIFWKICVLEIFWLGQKNYHSPIFGGRLSKPSYIYSDAGHRNKISCPEYQTFFP